MLMTSINETPIFKIVVWRTQHYSCRRYPIYNIQKYKQIQHYSEVREGVKNTIESVIMIIPSRGGGVVRMLGFFSSMLQTQLFGSIRPKTNFVLIQKLQFQTIFNKSYHVDLASYTLFRQGMIMITDSMGFFISLP